MSFDDDVFSQFIENWVEGIHPELGFWSEWFRTKGLKWPGDYENRMKSEPPFLLSDYLVPGGSWPPRVLDVGSGPISPVGLSTAKGNVVLHACDPLASFYKEIFTQYQITPYVVPEFAYAEALNDLYQASYFDIVHMSNALDHSFIPLAALINMLTVVKPDGVVILSHAENEAENEKYQGFHQWNITEVDEQLIIWNRELKININQELASCAAITTWRIKGQKDTICVKLKKLSDSFPVIERYKNYFDGILLKMFVGYINNNSNIKI